MRDIDRESALCELDPQYSMEEMGGWVKRGDV